MENLVALVTPSGKYVSLEKEIITFGVAPVWIVSREARKIEDLLSKTMPNLILTRIVKS